MKTRKVVLACLVLGILHFLVNLAFNYMLDKPIYVFTQLITSFIYAVVIITILYGIYLWRKQWKNKHN